MSGASVLYDVPGPRAVLRNRILGLVTVLIVLAAVGFIVYRFAATGQFDASRWNLFTYSLVWQGMAQALWATVSAFLAAGVGSIVLGFVLAIGRLSDHAWVRVPVTVVIELLRAVPVLVMMMIFFYGVNSIPGSTFRMSAYAAVVIGLVLYNGSVLAEALRAGIEALPRGQKEAGYAIGLRKSGVMAFILLPQAIRAMLPVIVAQLVVTLKDTALGFIITYPELIYYAKYLSSQPGRPLLQAGLIVAVIYISMCLILSGIAKWLEVRTRRSPKMKGYTPDAGGGDPRIHDGSTVTEVIAMQRGAGKFDGTSTGPSV
ncbi:MULTISPECIES: amino acid ABC transporter permease [unclassified Microbacterium]|uniref:amino acid ABC transporter permease n=1 Tax=unclassified Microbacterium TaxID=2609290 RepID=UPI001AC6FA11|nr:MULTISPECIES: amino acid ABC transporter permease [unclassified Microbacterium]MBN9159239.1 amino acid ABC transporter permease [Microbacterium sp.]